MRIPSGDDFTFEESYPKAEFSELIRLGIAFAGFIRRISPRLNEGGTASAIAEVDGRLPSAELPVVNRSF